MSNLPEVNLPDDLSAFFQQNGVPDDLADIKTVLLAGAFYFAHDQSVFDQDYGYLENAGNDLIQGGEQSLARHLSVRAANLYFGADLFNLDKDETFDWVIFCNWFVSNAHIHSSRGKGSMESARTFQKNSWTEAFTTAGVKGFTVVGDDDGVNLLRSLALTNNEGISLLGGKYSFFCDTKYDAQNYLFSPSQP